MKRFTRLLSITTVFTLLVSLSNCGKEKTDPLPTTTPTVVTGDVTSITTTSATGSGQIVSDGNVTVSERGVVIGKTADPTISDTKVLSGKGAGTFSVEVTGLTANTTYHIRAFGTNAKGTSYGLDKLFTTSPALPNVTTSAVSAITLSAASSGGIITSDGGAAITARGICWSATPNPTIANSKTTDGSGAGTFTSSLISLSSGTKYYVRAYATNNVGTAYGNELNFTTLTSPIPTNGLIGWWPFNGNPNDESGNGNNATPINGVTLSADRFGISSAAYSFDGIDDRLLVSNKFFNNGWDEFTISGWVKFDAIINPNNVNSSHIIFNSGPHNGFALGANYLSSQKYALWVGDGSPSISWNQLFNAKSSQSITVESWKHIVLIKKAKTYSFYINGSLDSSWTISTMIQSYFYQFYFGSGDPLITNEVMIGKLDDIGIWNRALTADEILKIYNGTGF